MFDIGASELLVIVIVAILVIGPKDMPMAMRTAGRWIGKVRRVSSHFRSGIDAMIREAELEDMEKKWKAQNEAIMAKSAGRAEPLADQAKNEMTGPPPAGAPASASAEARTANPPAAPPAPMPDEDDPVPDSSGKTTEPELPLGKSDSAK